MDGSTSRTTMVSIVCVDLAWRRVLEVRGVTCRNGIEVTYLSQQISDGFADSHLDFNLLL